MNSEISQKPPLSFRILGWIFIIGGLVYVLKIILAGSDFGIGRGTWNVFLKTLAILAGIGFLRLRKWAIYLYFGGFIAGTLSFYIFPPSEEALAFYSQPITLAMLFVVPAIVGIFVWKHWNRLT